MDTGVKMCTQVKSVLLVLKYSLDVEVVDKMTSVTTRSNSVNVRVWCSNSKPCCRTA